MKDSTGEQLIDFDVALKVADAAVFAQTKRHLKNIEVAVLRGAWFGQRYDEIATENGYTPEYIKHDVGPKLWQILSSSLGEKVNKTNLVAVLAQREHQVVGENVPPSDSSSLKLESLVGLIPLNSTFYVERPTVESRCYEEIMKPGALIRIKAPSQMGKTSLMVRILARAKQQISDAGDVCTVPLSLQRADRSVFTDLDKFLRWFCASITRKLQLPHRVEDYWSETFGSKNNCTAYFEDCLLPEINGSLVLAIDQVDEVFLHPEIADDFFTLLRSWYEEAAYGDSGNPLWQNLRLIIVHSTEVYIPLDINKSPFNVGLAIELHAFNSEQVFDLAQRYRLNLSETELSQLMQLVAGHPYLVQQALYHLAQQDLTQGQLVQTAATDAGIYYNHLHRHLRSLQEHPQLAAAYDQVIKASKPVDLEQLLAFKLHSMGLVALRGNQVVPSCELYRRYFSDRLPSP
jgi:DNA-directed RNA polymerase specialized sigma24 family protein